MGQLGISTALSGPVWTSGNYMSALSLMVESEVLWLLHWGRDD